MIVDDAEYGNAEAITRMLEVRYHQPEWATFAELRTGTGFGGDREQRLDLFAFRMYRSARAITHEVKVSRADFRRELERPEKRAFAEHISTECFFVTPPGLVAIDEVPASWGLMEATRAGLKVRKAAKQYQMAELEPWPLHFIQALARRSCDDPKTVSKTMWRYAGQELNDEQLVRIAEEVYAKSLEMATRSIERKYADFDLDELERLRDLRREVAHVTGTFRPDAAGFKEWAERYGIAEGRIFRTLEDLGRLLGPFALKQEEEAS